MDTEIDTPDLEYTEETSTGQEPPQPQTPPEQSGGSGEGTGTAEGRAPSDEMASAMRELANEMKVSRSQQQAQPAPGRAPTQEEINQFWGVWDPTTQDPDWFRKFLRLSPDMDPAEAAQAVKEFQGLFGQMQTGLVKQAIIGAQHLYKQEIDRLRQEFGPVQEYISTQRQEQIRGRFYSQYPNLKDSRFERIISAAARDLANKEFQDEGGYFKALAESAAESIRGLIPEFDLGAKSQNNSGKTPRLPRSGVGGTGGAGSSTGGGKASAGKSQDDSDSLW